MIGRLLVANRGEIARRVFHTCRSLGIETVAVYSDADAGSPHVTEADVAVRLPGVTAAETYLRADLIVDAALRAGADAVHPGYGFLSENAAFARAVIDAGLVWVGPPPEAIDSMGSKIEAKALMAAAGVPVLDRLDPSEIAAGDLPVLIKASAGGGGRGMRVVTDLADLATELDLAAREAESAFGDATVFCEPYLATGHHIEVQVMADAHETVLAIGERECSIQRRHQKIIEEAPAPLVERVAGMRERIFEASRAATAAIGYRGAGTVEFLADDDGRFFFLEMNTRLQVEHPVTEATTGTDLVAWQLLVAEGGALPAEAPPTVGHAIEVRLYAEDAAADWLPQSGTLRRFGVDGVDTNFTVGAGPEVGLRLDSGVSDGSAVSVHYDPMLAKLIAWAPTREGAVRRLGSALRSATIHGITTNRDLLVRVLSHVDFQRGATDTGFIGRVGLASLAEPLAEPGAFRVSALAAALAIASANRRDAAVLAGLPSGWRNVVSQPQCKRFRPLGVVASSLEHIEVTYRLTRGALVAEGFDDVELVTSEPECVVLDVAGVQHRFAVADYGELVCVDSALGAVTFQRVGRFPDATSDLAPGSLLAPMPGVVVRIATEMGAEVEQGQPLMWLEAMKMQHQINAPMPGTVTDLLVSEGQQVDVGDVLAVVVTQENQ